MRGGAALHGRKGGGAMPRGKRAYRVLLWAVLAALLALAALWAVLSFTGITTFIYSNF